MVSEFDGAVALLCWIEVENAGSVVLTRVILALGELMLAPGELMLPLEELMLALGEGIVAVEAADDGAVVGLVDDAAELAIASIV